MEEDIKWISKLESGVTRPPGAPELNIKPVSDLLRSIWQFPDSHIVSKLHLPVSSLKYLVGSRWLSSDLIHRFIALINRSSNDTHAIYLNDALVSNPQTFSKHFTKDNLSKDLRKLVFCVNVGRKGNSTFVGGERYQGKSNPSGCHFTVAVYHISSKILYYGDSLGWDVPEDLPSSITNCLKAVGLLTETADLCIKSLHDPKQGSSTPVHICSENCWPYFPLQKDGHSCGVSTIMVMCLVAFDEKSFWSLKGPQKHECTAFQFLANVSLYSDYLRAILITWLMQNSIDLKLFSGNGKSKAACQYSNSLPVSHQTKEIPRPDDELHSSFESLKSVDIQDINELNKNRENIVKCEGDDPINGIKGSLSILKSGANLDPSTFTVACSEGGTRRCSESAHHLHCTLCPNSVKFDFLSIAKRHVLHVHLNEARVVHFGNEIILPCKKCQFQGQRSKEGTQHYHCPLCSTTIRRKSRFKSHLDKHSKNVATEGLKHFSNIKENNREQREQIDKAANVEEPVKVARREKHIERVMCGMCQKLVTKKNLNRHYKRWHDMDIRFSAICCDKTEGLYMVKKSVHGGIGYPLHVQKLLKSGLVDCEDDRCREEMAIAARSGMNGRECHHLLLVNNAFYPDLVTLSEDKLYELASDDKYRILSEETVNSCLDLKYGCDFYNHPLVVSWKDSNYIHLSVYNSKYMNIPIRSRCVVSYNSLSGRLDCRCQNKKYFCIHKAVSLWYLYEKNELKDLDLGHDKQLGTENTQEINDETCKQPQDLLYPPKSPNALENMIKYSLSKKTIPFPLPDEFVKVSRKDIPRSFKPIETECHICKTKLSRPVRITRNARLLTLTGFLDSIETFFAKCEQCDSYYRYEEYKDGVHNFDDIFLIGLDFCNLLRECLKNHMAVGKICAIAEGLLKTKLDSNLILNSYLHFESLSNRTYEFNCVECGYYPHILIADVNRKVAFKYREPDEKTEEQNYSDADEVDCKKFWDDVTMEMVSRGCRGRKVNEMTVSPKLSNWAPYIGEKSRIGNIIYNSEHQKVHAENDDIEIECREMSEERLLETLFESTSKEVRLLAKKLGVAAKGSKLDIINRIKTGLGKNNIKFNKIFRKMFGFSGGWLTVACQHGIIYAIKFLLRSESPRDYLDILRGLRHRPNIFINDMAHIVSAFANRKFIGFFSPNDGRAAESTNENVQMANDGTLQVSFPWINSDSNTNRNLEPNSHPVTGSAHHLALFDRLHEKNTSNEVEALRRIACVKELSGQINSQVAEQIHGSFNLNRYFLNKMSPSNHIFMFRSIIDLVNESRNLVVVSEMEKRTKLNVRYDLFGRAIFCHTSGKGRDYSDLTRDKCSDRQDSNDQFFESMRSNDSNKRPNEAQPNFLTVEEPALVPDYEEFVNGFLHEGSANNWTSSPSGVNRGKDSSRASSKLPSPNQSYTAISTNEEFFQITENSILADNIDDSIVFVTNDEAGTAKRFDENTGSGCGHDFEHVTSFSCENKVISSDHAHFDLNENHLHDIDLGLPVSSSIINAAMGVMRRDFQNVEGLHQISDILTVWGSGNRFIQIIPLNDSKKYTDWGTLSNMVSSDKQIHLYDSLLRNHLSNNKRECKYDISIEAYAARLRHPKNDKFEIHVADTVSSLRDSDSGIAAIFFALCLCRKMDPQVTYFNLKNLRKHLIKALRSKTFEGIQFVNSPRESSGTKFIIKPSFYCHCNLPDMKTKMICCSSCKSWYHCDCEEDIHSSPWLCRKCKKLKRPIKIVLSDSDEYDNMTLLARSHKKAKRGIKATTRKKRPCKEKTVKKPSFKELLDKVISIRPKDSSSSNESDC